MNAPNSEQRQMWTTPQLTLVDTGLEAVTNDSGPPIDSVAFASITSGFGG